MAVDRVSQPSSQEPVTIVSVRSTSTSKPTAKAQSNLIDEIATVDIFLWLISGAKGVEPFDDDVLSAIQTYFAAHPDVHAPVLIPVVILHPNAASTVDPIGAEPQILMNIAQLAKKYGAEPPVTIRMANGTTDVLPLWSNIQAISPRARRVQFIRHIARQKSTNKRPFLPKQVLSAVVALGKSITRRDTSKRPKL